MTKKLIWRLNSSPTLADLSEAVKAGIIDQKEAREILVREEEEPKKATPSEITDVKKEIELLRELVLALAARRDASTVIYKYIDKWNYGWTQPYKYYCSSIGGNTLTAGTLTTNLGTNTTNAVYSTFTNTANSLLNK